MTSNSWEIPEARVEKLEKEHRWLKRAWVFTCLAVVGVLTLGASRAGSTVEAERFLLEGANGGIRAELTTLDGDYPRLSLMSPNKEKVTELSPLGVSVFDKALPGNLPLGHFGNTGLYFTDERGQVVIELGGASVSGPQLAPAPEFKLFDTKGRPLWHDPYDCAIQDPANCSFASLSPAPSGTANECIYCPFSTASRICSMPRIMASLPSLVYISGPDPLLSSNSRSVRAT